MTQLVFETYGDLTSSLAFDLIDRLKGLPNISTSYGRSNQSPSAYVEVDFLGDEEEIVKSVKVRFSDHNDRHGADVSFDIKSAAPGVYDDGEYVQTEISSEDYESFLCDALRFVHESLIKERN